MSSDQSDPPVRRWIIRLFERAENGLYIALGSILAALAAILLIFSTIEFATHLLSGPLEKNIVDLLGHLLLVLLIVELLYTVQVSYRAGTIVLEPFLFVGIIAAIRRIFVLTAEFSDPASVDPTAFRHFIMELGTLTVLIIVIVIAVLLLRKSAEYIQEDEGRSDMSKTGR